MKNIAFVFTFILLSTLCIAQQNDLKSLQKKLEIAKNDSIKCTILYDLIDQSTLNEKENYANSLLKIAQKNLLKTPIKKATKDFYAGMEIEVLSNLGLLSIDKSDYSTKTENVFKTAQQKANALKNPNLIAMCGNNLGLLFYLKGNINKALELYKSALNTLEKNNLNEGRSYLMNNIASIYHENKDFDLAIKYYKQCLTKYALENEKRSVVSIYNNIGSIYSEQKKLDLAFFYLNKSIALAIETKDVKEQTTARNNIGIAFVKNNESQKAIDNYLIANKLAQSIDFKEGIVISNCRMSEIYRKNLDNKKAIDYAKNAMEIAKILKSPDMLSRSAYQLMLAYEKVNNYKDAYLLKDVYVSNLDSIRNKKLEKEIIHSQYQQEYSSKAIRDSLYLVSEKKISLLQVEKQKNQKQYFALIAFLVAAFAFFVYKKYKQTNRQKIEIESQNLIIQKSLSEKEVLLKEIHHRVKNNLQVISSLLGLQSSKIEDQYLKNIFVESKNKINTISLIHQKLYQNNNLAEIDMKDYFASLYAAILSVFENLGKKVTLKLETNQIVFDIDTSVPLGLIFNELITNSFKYAFENTSNPEIAIELKVLNLDQFQLEIADNGSGFITDNKNTTSLGLKLVGMLASQLNGTFDAENNFGTKNIIIFQDTKQRKLND